MTKENLFYQEISESPESLPSVLDDPIGQEERLILIAGWFFAANAEIEEFSVIVSKDFLKSLDYIPRQLIGLDYWSWRLLLSFDRNSCHLRRRGL